MDEYRSYDKQYLDSSYFKETIFYKYKETTYTTWRVTITAIENYGLTGDLALRILRLMSYLDGENIRRDIFFNF